MNVLFIIWTIIMMGVIIAAIGSDKEVGIALMIAGLICLIISTIFGHVVQDLWMR